MTYQYKREPLSIEEADRLWSACQDAEEKLVVWTLMETGFRVSELAGLRAEQIQWQQGAIRVMGKGGPYGKRSKFRAVPISNRIRPLLEHYFALHDAFPFRKRSIQKIVKRVADRARISRPVSPHVLRHTFSVIWLHRGGSTRALQLILGHDHLSTTEIYLNLSPQHVIDEFRRKWDTTANRHEG